MQPRGHMGTQEMLKVIRRNILEAFLQVMSVVNYRKGQKQLKIFALHLKSTLARPPIYDGAYPEMLSTASAGNPVGIMKPTSYLLFVQLAKKSMEQSTSIKGTLVLDKFRLKIHEKSSLEVETWIKTHCTRHLKFSSIELVWITLNEARWTVNEW